MSYEEDEEIEALLAKKREELRRYLEQRRALEEKRREEELARENILRMILTEEARERLMRIKLARPDFARLIENQLILLAQSGKIVRPLTDEEFKEILKRITGKRREGSIKFMRKTEVI